MSPVEHQWALPEFPEVMTVDEAAKFLGLGRSALYDAIGRGEVPHRRIGKAIRLSKTALIAWLGEYKSGSCNAPDRKETR